MQSSAIVANPHHHAERPLCRLCGERPALLIPDRTEWLGGLCPLCYGDAIDQVKAAWRERDMEVL